MTGRELFDAGSRLFGMWVIYNGVEFLVSGISSNQVSESPADAKWFLCLGTLSLIAGVPITFGLATRVLYPKDGHANEKGEPAEEGRNDT